jgi:diguanylate cyclase (GGDEF)-like protein/PAS domain S-box-containing protein
MGPRNLNAVGEPSSQGEPGDAAARASVAAAHPSPKLLLDCTRAALRARDEADLVRSVETLLVQSGEYAEASVLLGAEHTAHAQPAGADRLALSLGSSGRSLGVLALRTAAQREPADAEREQLSALAADTGFALARLQRRVRRRAVAASERRLREHAGVGITRVDMDGRYTEVNQKFCDMLGYTREELLGRRTREVTLPEDYGPGAAFREQARLGHATVSIAEKRYVRKDGGYVWARRTMSPTYDETGAVTEMINVVEDITERKAAEDAHAREHTLLRTIIDALPHYIYVKDRSGHLTMANQSWLTARGFRLDQIRGKSLYDVFPADLARLLDAQEKPIVEKGESIIDLPQHVNFTKPDGTAVERWSLTTKVPLRDSEGTIIGVVGISRDITERKRIEDSLQESEQQLRAMFENADVGISVTGLDLKFLRVNDKYCSIVGYTREEMLAMSVTDINLPENVPALMHYRDSIARGEAVEQTREKQLLRKDGSLVWVSMATSVVRAADGTPRYFIAVIQDISEAKRAATLLKESEEQYRRLAHYDALTRLPNRSLFYDRLAHAIAQARRNVWTLAVLFIDVDRFKHVNDTFGHTAGDVLLKTVSERLAECVRSDDTVGRLSGDEFAIVLSRISAPEDAATVAQKIVDALNQPFQLEGAELFVTASIGITVYPNDSDDQDALIRNADVAMYRAKERGRNNYQFYMPEMNRRTREMLSMESELRRALERDEFIMHYQPKVCVLTGRITGVEALLRWMHPERGLVPPGDFIPLLEETGLVVQAGAWVLAAVCRQIKAWQKAGIDPVPVAMNLSARQFLAPDLAGSIRRALDTHAVDAHLLEVEITESAIMTNTEEAIRTLEELQAMGVETAVDDFGTGYSSLGYLKRFPLRALKVDRSFIRDITTDPDDATITQAVISMAHSLELKVIAEGVETEAQLEFLERYGCDEVQGYIYSKPLPADECAVLIADEKLITDEPR